jgi:hypothetical protein
MVAATPPIILFLTLAFGSLQLKTSGLGGELSFVVLLIASLVSGFIIYFRDRLKKADLKGGFELFEAVREVKEAEDRIKVMAHRVADLVEAANQGSWKDESYAEDIFNKAVQNVRNI